MSVQGHVPVVNDDENGFSSDVPSGARTPELTRIEYAVFAASLAVGLSVAVNEKMS